MTRKTLRPSHSSYPQSSRDNYKRSHAGRLPSFSNLRPQVREVMEEQYMITAGGSETFNQKLPVLEEDFASSSLFGDSLGCCSCFGRRRSSSVGSGFLERIWTIRIKSENGFWGRGLRAFQKIREWSELVAGPRWKTFIRRFNRNQSTGCRQGKFHYDPLSYAMNFDDGLGQNRGLDEGDDYGGFRSFSVRYASFPGPNMGPVKVVAAAEGVDVHVQKDVAVFG